MAADCGKRGDRLVGDGNLVHQELLVGRLDLLHGDRDPWSEALFDEGVDRCHPQHELVDIGPHETLLLQARIEGLLTAGTRDQCIAVRAGLELEAIQKARILEVAELDLESDTGAEQA